MTLNRLTVSAFAVLILLAGCATTPTTRTTTGPTTTPAQEFALRPAQFSDLPGWQSADLAPAFTAFRRQCAAWSQRTPDAPLSATARYGGPVGQWLTACNAAMNVAPGGERAFFEAQFTPASVVGPGEARLTAYYEPVIQTSRQAQPGFTEPLLRRPNDMVTIDLSAFAEALDNDTLRGAPRALTGQLQGDRVRPYPQRGQITAQPGQVIAWAHPADVYNLQVQGSGRIHYPDGQESRAQFAAQNGYRWKSALGVLRDAGQLPSPTWGNFRTWIDAHPAQAEAALDADPSYVFFTEEAIADPSAGPRGAAGVPLTAQGSLAVDPAFHPYGAVLFVDGTFGGAPFQRLLVAQDTGGAIRRGPLRGDVFFGSGPEAGAAAEQMNAPARIWTLLPRGVPIS